MLRPCVLNTIEGAHNNNATLQMLLRVVDPPPAPTPTSAPPYLLQQPQDNLHGPAPAADLLLQLENKMEDQVKAYLKRMQEVRVRVREVVKPRLTGVPRCLALRATAHFPVTGSVTLRRMYLYLATINTENVRWDSALR